MKINCPHCHSAQHVKQPHINKTTKTTYYYCADCNLDFPFNPNQAGTYPAIRLGESILDFTPAEQLKLSYLLTTYFPELGTEEEMNGGDVVEELCKLYSALPQVD